MSPEPPPNFNSGRDIPPRRDAGVPRHQPRAPMGCIDGNLLGGQQQDPFNGSPFREGRSARPRAVHQAGKTDSAVAVVPELHGRPVDVHAPAGVGRATPGIERKQDAGSTRLATRRRWTPPLPSQQHDAVLD